MAAVDPQTTQLEFYQAMADFKTMFPSMDDDVIEAVLRSNKGAVDATIDQLLAMSTDYENEKIRMELDIKDQQTVPHVDTAQLVPVDDEPDLPLTAAASTNESQQETSSQGLPISRKYSSSLLMLGQLPDDFLRLAHDSQTEMEMEDERIAALLQNEEFMKELRWNKDFLSTLDRESSDAINSRFPLRVVDDEAAFKEKLKHMGKLSKKKISQLGRVFTGRKKKGAKAILNENAAKDNLLLREDQDSD